MRVSDWSSDVCSSDLPFETGGGAPFGSRLCASLAEFDSAGFSNRSHLCHGIEATQRHACPHALQCTSSAPRQEHRKSVEQGKSASVRVDPGGRRSIKNKTTAYPLSLTFTQNKT